MIILYDECNDQSDEFTQNRGTDSITYVIEVIMYMHLINLNQQEYQPPNLSL